MIAPISPQAAVNSASPGLLPPPKAVVATINAALIRAFPDDDAPLMAVLKDRDIDRRPTDRYDIVGTYEAVGWKVAKFKIKNETRYEFTRTE